MTNLSQSIVPIGLSRDFKLVIREDARAVLRELDKKLVKRIQKLHRRARKIGSIAALANALNLNIRFTDGTRICCYGAKLIGKYIFLVSFDRARLTIHTIVDILRLQRSKKTSPCLVMRKVEEFVDGQVCIDMHVVPQGLHKKDATFCGVTLSWHGRFRRHFVPRLQVAHAYSKPANEEDFELKLTQLSEVRG